MASINMKDKHKVLLMDNHIDNDCLPTENMISGETLLPSDVNDAEEIHDWIMQLSNNNIS